MAEDLESGEDTDIFGQNYAEVARIMDEWDNAIGNIESYANNYVRGYYTGRPFMVYTTCMGNELFEKDWTSPTSALRGYIDGTAAGLFYDRDPNKIADAMNQLAALRSKSGHVLVSDFCDIKEPPPIENELLDEFEADLTARVWAQMHDSLDVFNEYAFMLGDLPAERILIMMEHPFCSELPYKPKHPCAILAMGLHLARIKGWDMTFCGRDIITPQVREKYVTFPWDSVKIVETEFHNETKEQIEEQAVICARLTEGYVTRRAEIFATYAAMRRVGICASVSRCVLEMAFGRVPLV